MNYKVNVSADQYQAYMRNNPMMAEMMPPTPVDLNLGYVCFDKSEDPDLSKTSEQNQYRFGLKKGGG